MQNDNTNFIDSTKENLPYKGELIIRELDLAGNVVYEYTTPNTIVYDARGLMASLLAGDDTTNRKIGKLGVGLDGTAPSRDDSALGNEKLKVDIVGYTFPEEGHVEFTALLDNNSAANGDELREVGLFSNDGTTLFARQVFGTITKSSSLQLQVVWRIIFT